MTRSAPLLFLLGGLLFFFALGHYDLQGSTETRVAGIAMAMHLDNDWVVPRLFGEPFLEKPPLSLWLDASAIRWVGATPMAVRLASACAGLACMLLLYGMLRRFGRPKGLAFTAALMLATTAIFWSNVRGVGEDALLCLGVTLALLAFYQAMRGAAGPGAWAMFTLGMVIATLSKGVLGLAMPGVVIFAYLACTSCLDRRLRISDWLRPALFTLVGLMPLLVWLCLLYQRGGMQAVAEVLWTNSVGRFSGSFVDAGHYEPFYYYIAKLPQMFLPWNLLVYLGLWRFRKSLAHNRYRLFFSLWLVAQFTLLTFASSKRTVYLMSMTPAAAVLAAEYAAVWLRWLALRPVTSPWAAGLRTHRQNVLKGAFGLVMACYLATAWWFAPRNDEHLSFVPLVSQIQALRDEGHQVVLYKPSERVAGASVFYNQAQLTILQEEPQLRAYLGAATGNVALVDDTNWLDMPFKVLKAFTVGRQSYAFVQQ